MERKIVKDKYKQIRCRNRNCIHFVLLWTIRRRLWFV